jgi:DNA-binding transcriptional LysR family regulator
MDQWPGVEIRHLAALEAIDAERSFRGAADRLGYVQSAVSQQISALERLVGVRLVERQRGHARVDLTDAGAVLVRHAEKIQRQLTAARADLAATSSTEGEVLRVGVFETVGTQIIPRVLTRLRIRRPELRVLTIEARGDGDLFPSVARGDVDCGFADLPLLHGPFQSVELLVDPCVLVVSSDSPLAGREQPPSLREIAQLPLATHNWRFFELIEQIFRVEGLDLAPTYRMETNAATRALVSSGLAAAIMPLLSARSEGSGCEMIDLGGLLPARTIVAYWHQDRLDSPALKSFIDECRSVCRALHDEQGESHESAGGLRLHLDPMAPIAEATNTSECAAA